MITAGKALELIVSHATPAQTITLPLREAIGNTIAERIDADRDYPPFNRATMDGFAVTLLTIQPNTPYDFSQEMTAGMNPEGFSGERILKISTGCVVPKHLDAIIRTEDCVVKGSTVLFVHVPTKRFHNIAIQGEDLRLGNQVLEPGTKLDVSATSLLASLGKTRIQVYAKPSVAIVSTGNEIVPIEQTPSSYQIRNSNQYTLLAFLQAWGIEPQMIKTSSDDTEELAETILDALRYDILIVSGGVSMGKLDLVPSILGGLGVQEIFHKAEIKPGKPIWFGKRESTAVFALPGNPFSVQVCAKIFVEPYLCKIQGLSRQHNLFLPFGGTRNKKKHFTEYFPVQIETQEIQSQKISKIRPLSFNGSGDIKAGLFSHGIAIHPPHLETINSGDFVEFIAW